METDSIAVDLLVLGTGAAGQSIAYPCASAGWRVAVVDSRPYGGTCENRGCDPKKVLVGGADLVDWSWRMAGKGVTRLTLAWPELMRFKRTFTDPVPDQVEQGFHDASIQTLHGRAHFVDRDTVRVGARLIAARHVAIAAGARHAPLGIPGEDLLTTSTQFLSLEALPPRVVFIGGGYIAFEFGHLAIHTGATVTILHRGPRPLERFDGDLVARLAEATRAMGVDLRVRHAVAAVERVGDHLAVRARGPEGERTIEADLVVHAAGRIPEIDDLELERAGIAREKTGITVNEYLQSTTHPGVYAAGDAVASGGLPLTPVAGMQGGIVAHNLLHGNSRRPDYTGIPSVVFTIPPLAAVGLTEDAARQRGLRFQTHAADTTEWYASRRVAERASGFKVLVEDGTERILGAHVFGPESSEVINLFSLAMRADLRAPALREMVYAYPTNTSNVPYML